MAKADPYNDLIFSLGDLARERLSNKSNRPRAMERVFKAEDAVVARRGELEALERGMNDEDQRYQDFIASAADEKESQSKVIGRYRKAVDAIAGRVKESRKKLSNARADLRYNKEHHKKAVQRHEEYEMTVFDPKKVEASKDNIKKMKLALMRRERNVEEMEQEFLAILTPEEGQPGAPGILAHRRVLELEDALEKRKDEFDGRMQTLDVSIGKKEEEVRAAEDYLDQAIFLLGEECYSLRFPDPALAAMYPKIDKAK